MKQMRIAIVAPWYVSNGGAEKVDGILGEIYPEADLYALFFKEKGIPRRLHGRHIHGSFLNYIPAIDKVYRPLLGLLPYCVESLNLSKYDLVISSDWACVKGVLIDETTWHICYCHSPMRHIWDLYRTYLNDAPMWQRPAFAWSAQHLRQWDFKAAQRVDHFIANSHYIAQRIQTYYGRKSSVIYPPVDTSKGYLASQQDSYYLATGRLHRTKRLD